MVGPYVHDPEVMYGMAVTRELEGIRGWQRLKCSFILLEYPGDAVTRE
jgi:hypothetical protein